MKKNIQSLTIASKTFTRNNPLIIAEIGTAHGGSLNKAKELVAAAAEAGAGCAFCPFAKTRSILATFNIMLKSFGAIFLMLLSAEPEISQE